MTRTRNSSFFGTAPPDADVDAPISRTALLEVVQDANLTYDIVTGENSPSASATIIHNGELGRGGPLRRPIACQELLGNFPLRMSEADVATYGGRCHIIATPIFVAQGEYVQRIEVIGYVTDDTLECEIRDGSWAVVAVVPLTRSGSIGDQVRYAGVLQLTTPGVYYLTINQRVDEEYQTLIRWRVFPYFVRAGVQASVPSQASGYFPFPSGTPASEYETIHDEMIAEQRPLSSWVLSTLSRNLNWLLEHISGHALPGNAGLHLTEGAQPFFDHSRAILASQPLVELPVWCEALGAIQVGGDFTVNAAGDRGLIAWAPVIPRYDGTTRRTFYQTALRLPNFTSGQNLRAVALAFTDGKGDTTDWDFRVTTGAGSCTAANFTSLGGGGGAYAAAVDSIPFAAGGLETFAFELARAAGSTVHGEIAVTGLLLYFDP